jgi:hypothetical protein
MDESTREGLYEVLSTAAAGEKKSLKVEIGKKIGGC